MLGYVTSSNGQLHVFQMRLNLGQADVDNCLRNLFLLIWIGNIMNSIFGFYLLTKFWVKLHKQSEHLFHY